MAEGQAHANVLESQSMSSSSLPLLVFHHHPRDQEDNEMLMFSISQQSLHENVEQGLLAAGNTMCWSTPQGWMLLVVAQDDHAAVSSAACLWNPRTGDKLSLPEIGDEHQFPYHGRCLLTHKDPAHPGCVAVLFNNAASDFWYYHTSCGKNNSGGGGGSWRHYSYDIGRYNDIPELRRRRRTRPDKKIICEMASFQGKIYFCSGSRGMCTIDFSSCTSTANHGHPTFEKLSIPSLRFPEGLCSGKQCLVGSQDQLFVVTLCFTSVDPNDIVIEVHRMDSSSSSTQQASWCSVHDIGDVVFLLDGSSNMAASCSASTLGLDANKILFMKNFMEDDGDLCVFDLGTNTEEIIRVHHRDELILCRKPFWIVPPS